MSITKIDFDHVIDESSNYIIAEDGSYVIVNLVETDVESKGYKIELRDKDGNLRQYLTPFVSKVSWEWRRIGGCGRAGITLDMDYRKIDFGPDDDIQIRIGSGTTSKLVYRGWIAKITPSLKIGQQIKLDVRGYFDKLIKLMVQDNGADKVYENYNILNIVTDLVDTYVTPNSDITKGTIDAGGYSPDTITFKTSVKAALRTLADLEGQVEYGVDEDLNFFWTNQSDVLVRKWFVGNNVTKFERRINWDALVNKIYFEGGELSDGSKYIKTAEASDSQDSYFLAEKIEGNSSITTSSVADQYLGSILRDKSKPQLEMRVSIANTDIRLEDSIPLGKVAVADADYDQNINIVGKTASGGSNLIVGRITAGGSNAIVGGIFKDQIELIKYKMSNTDERFNIDITFGGTISESSARIKQIELLLDSVRQR